jgi:AraC family transcriptional regulator of adaptative response / methylphosphotriester-DNA alkyltransferase methyltransferase
MRLSDGEMYDAVVRCDGKYDTVFYYAVKTVGVYCRPSCRSRSPLRKNVKYFKNPHDAESAGYRPCKRCRPDLLEYEPAKEIAEQAKGLIDQYFAKRTELDKEMRELGMTSAHLAAVFKQEYGLTPVQYLASLRFERAKKLLSETDESIDFIAYDVGFDSLTAFYRFFKKHADMTPTAFRKQTGCADE